MGTSRVRWLVTDKTGKVVGTELLPRPATNWWATYVTHPARPDWTMRRVWAGPNLGMTDTRLV
jgi:hypothetical protein